MRRRRDVVWRSDGYLTVSTVEGVALTATGPAPEICGLLDGWTTIDELAEDSRPPVSRAISGC